MAVLKYKFSSSLNNIHGSFFCFHSTEQTCFCYLTSPILLMFISLIFNNFLLFRFINYFLDFNKKPQKPSNKSHKTSQNHHIFKHGVFYCMLQKKCHVTKDGRFVIQAILKMSVFFVGYFFFELFL